MTNWVRRWPPTLDCLFVLIRHSSFVIRHLHGGWYEYNVHAVAAALFHVGVGDRGAPGQALRPDLGRGARRDHGEGPAGARRLRDGDDDRTRPRLRRDH